MIALTKLAVEEANKMLHGLFDLLVEISDFELAINFYGFVRTSKTGNFAIYHQLFRTVFGFCLFLSNETFNTR